MHMCMCLRVQVCEHLHEGRYTLEEIEGLIGTPLEKLYADSPVALKVRGGKLMSNLGGRREGGSLAPGM